MERDHLQQVCRGMHELILRADAVCSIVLIGLGALAGVYFLKQLSTKQHGQGTGTPPIS